MLSVTVRHWRGTGKVGQFAGHEGVQKIGGIMFHAFQTLAVDADECAVFCLVILLLEE
jgi:hypothetical protein